MNHGPFDQDSSEDLRLVIIDARKRELRSVIQQLQLHIDTFKFEFEEMGANTSYIRCTNGELNEDDYAFWCESIDELWRDITNFVSEKCRSSDPILDYLFKHREMTNFITEATTS